MTNRTPGWERFSKRTKTINASCAMNTTKTEIESEMLEALEFAQKLISIARRYFPKSIQNSDTFQLENTCATIGKAIRKARNE